MRLEVGPGSRPKLVGEDVIYLDIRRQDTPNLILADAENLPFRDETFDEVMASHVIEHPLDPKRFIRETHRVLRLEGKLVIYTPNFLSINVWKDPDHKHSFNVFNIKQLLAPEFKVHYMCNIAHRIPFKRLFKLLFLIVSDELAVVGFYQPTRYHLH